MQLRPAVIFLFLLLSCATESSQRQRWYPQYTVGPQQPAYPPVQQGPPTAPPNAAQAMLSMHNQLRARHCTAPLAWSDEVARAAQGWAQQLTRTCNLQHSSLPYGENIWAGTAGAFSVQDVVNSWYSEIAQHNYRAPETSEAGHFTQLLWRGSQRLGCGSAICGQTQIWVCDYDPPGNVQGAYAANVLPPNCGH